MSAFSLSVRVRWLLVLLAATGQKVHFGLQHKNQSDSAQISPEEVSFWHDADQFDGKLSRQLLAPSGPTLSPL
jgi:hypothetical protein